ncbi:MAG: IclR family transcriptional regulator [Halanaeroarchaeum sp.]
MAGKNTVQSVETALEVVDRLAETEGARLGELADGLDMPPSTVHSHVATLHDRNFLAKEGDIYYLSMKFLTLGEQIRRRSAAYQLAEQKVHQIAKETGLRTHFIVEEEGKAWYLYSVSGDNAITAYASRGKQASLHASAGGKAILAAMPQVRVEAILDQYTLEAHTGETITDREELFANLDEIRERGYAYNLEEHLTGVNAIGTPVTKQSGTVVGAISVSGPATRMKGASIEEDLPNLLMEATNELELNITYS